jgi:transposase-like protein
MGVRRHPQQYLCETCGASFYAHTSAFFHTLFGDLKRLLKRALRGGRLDLKELAARFDLSSSAASRLLAALLRHLDAMGELKRYKELPRDGKVLFADETFLKIQGEQWYIVVLQNEHGKVLDALVTRQRSADVLLPRFRKAMGRMKRGVSIIVTDDFPAYQGAVLALKMSILHVRCVHKPPYGRVIIDRVRWEGNIARYTTVATICDVLKARNTFLARVTKHNKKIKTPGIKRGHPKGTKNRPRKVTLAERAEKTAQHDPDAHKPGRKNYTRSGEVHVFHYDPKGGAVEPWGGSDDNVAEMFTQLLPVFANKCITTNLEEQFFSLLKRLIHFCGWRTPEHWQQILDLFVVLRQEKGAVPHLVDLLEFRPQFLLKNLGNLATFRVTVPFLKRKR